MKKITVIIPTYKPDYYIWECLDSIKNQTLASKQFEVLIILNGEKEKYYTEINSYIIFNKLDNFKLIYTVKKGVSNARNIGLEQSTGEFIAFLDDDDVVEKEYLEFMLNVAKEKNTIVTAESINFYNNKIIKKKVKKVELKSYSLIKKRKSFSIVWGSLIPKEVIGNVRFNESYKNSEDSLFMMEISKNIVKVLSIEGIILHYRRVRYNSASYRRMSKKYILSVALSMLKEYLKLFIKKEYNKRFILLRIAAIIKGTIIQLTRKKGK